jgi:quercetin dioxygenase-like cupin family protein
MISTPHEWNGVVVSVFQMDAGEKIARHKHAHQHTHGVARGRTEVEIYDEGGMVFEMVPGLRDFPFPAEVEHEIRALEDGTIVINIAFIENAPAAFAPGGGIAMIDGSVT